MTIKRAIVELIDKKKLFYFSCADADDADVDSNSALDVAIEALKKQMPKKPIPKGKYHFSCPLCKNELGIEREDISVYDMTPPNFCENCGQALDWSDE